MKQETNASKLFQESIDELKKYPTLIDAPTRMIGKAFYHLGKINPNYFLDMNESNFNVTRADRTPVIFAYERLTPDLQFLWDANHMLYMKIWDLEEEFALNTMGLCSIFETYGLEQPKRPKIFTAALKYAHEKHGPVRNLGLEVTADRGQKVLDKFEAGKIEAEEAGEELVDGGRHMSTGFENYAPVLEFARENGIRLRAIDATSKEYEADDIFGIDQLVDFDLKKFLEKERLRDAKYVAPNIRKIASTGKTFTIIGGGHRMNLPELLK